MTRCSSSAPREAHVGRPEGHVLAHRAEEELVVGVLEDHADPPTHLLERRAVAGVDGAAAHAHVAGARRQDPVEVVHERGLAGAVRAEQRDALAGLEAEVDAEERLVAVGVGVREAADLQHGGHRVAPCACGPWPDAARSRGSVPV